MRKLILNKMGKYLLFFVLLFSSLHIYPQCYQGYVVDEETNACLPFATVFVSQDCRTVTNADGAFTLDTNLKGVAKISYVGYHELIIPLSRLNGTIKMKPYVVKLHEVTAYPIDVIIKRAMDQLLLEAKSYKNKESDFIYRQVTLNDRTCNEYIETFFNAKSEISLRKLSLITGRYATLKTGKDGDLSYCTNFFSLVQLGLLARKITKNMPIPFLTREYKKYYNIDYTILSGANSNIYVITFKAKRNVKKVIIEGKLFVDGLDYRILRCEGHLRNSTLSYGKRKIPLTLSINTVYTNRRGFTEIESEELSGNYRHLGKDIVIKALIYNVGEKKIERKKRIKYNYNLKEIISSMKYDSNFWKQHNEVRKTPLEKKVLELFESKNVFTNMK